jgi:hypothetical protein
MSLFNNIVDLLIKNCLTKGKIGFVVSARRNYFGFPHEHGLFHLEEGMSFVTPVALCSVFLCCW